MYKKETNYINVLNREATWYVLRDSILIYLQLLFLKPLKKDLRKQLIELLKLYLQSSKNEKEVLTFIKSTIPYFEEVEQIEELLDQLDENFEKRYRYYDYYLGKYEAVIDGVLEDASFSPERFPMLDDEKKKEYKK